MLDHKHLTVAVIIDVFRAFTTACYVLEQNPKQYIYAAKSFVLAKLARNQQHTLFIGKNEVGANLNYHIPNSPTRVKEINLTNKLVLHRTAAGAKGILNAKDTDIILAASFVNAFATVEYIKKLQKPKVTIIPMGHEASVRSMEDDICAKYIKSLLKSQTFNISPFIQQLKVGPGKYFFLEDQWQYPKEDFKRCLTLNCFHFPVRAKLYGDYAVLTKCE